MTFLVSAGAGKRDAPVGEWVEVPEDKFGMLRALDDYGLVEVARSEDTSLRCIFTQKALEDNVLLSLWKLDSPQRVLAIWDVSDAEKTSYELLRILLDRGRWGNTYETKALWCPANASGA